MRGGFRQIYFKKLEFLNTLLYMQTRAVLMYRLPLVAAARSLIVIKPTAPTCALPPSTTGTREGRRGSYLGALGLQKQN